jgi:hypothetical protein
MSRRPLPFLAAALFLVPFVACTSWKLETPVAAPINPGGAGPEGAAKVCVARTSVLASAVTFPTHDNGVLVGATRGPGYFCYLAAPGSHTIVTEADEPEVATLQAVAGRAYYLKEEVDNVFGYVKCRAVWVEGEAAANVFEGLSYEALVGVPGREKLPDPNAIVPAAVSLPAQ